MMMTGDQKSASRVESVYDRWTVDMLAVHHAALREADLAFQSERDRRYAEVAFERGKALEIEKNARADALQLAREIQTYKDEKANELREQLGRERLEYASKGDLKAAAEKLEETLKPIIAFVAGQRASGASNDRVWGYIFAALATGAALAMLYVKAN